MPNPARVDGFPVMLVQGNVVPANPVAVPLLTMDAPELIVSVTPEGTTSGSVSALPVMVLMTFFVCPPANEETNRQNNSSSAGMGGGLMV